jgi:hypothetical protein
MASVPTLDAAAMAPVTAVAAGAKESSRGRRREAALTAAMVSGGAQAPSSGVVSAAAAVVAVLMTASPMDDAFRLVGETVALRFAAPPRTARPVVDMKKTNLLEYVVGIETCTKV